MQAAQRLCARMAASAGRPSSGVRNPSSPRVMPHPPVEAA